MAGRLQNEDLKSEAELVALGADRTRLPHTDKMYIPEFGQGKTLSESVSSRLFHGAPLLIHQSLVADAKLNFEPSSIPTIEGSAKVMPPLKSQIFTIVASTIDFQLQSTTGGPFVIVFPTSTVGFFRYIGFTLLSSGSIQAIFTPENAVINSLANPGTTFVSGGMPLGYVLLECTNTAGKFKTAGSATNIIENIVSGNSRIFVFGSGGGAGAGTGDTTDLVERLKIMLEDSIYEFVTPAVFETDTTLIDTGNSTGSVDVTDGTYQIDATEVLRTTQLLDPDFLNESNGVPQIDLHVFWLLSHIDLSATYQVSRDGGANFQTITMTRIGETDEFQGTLVFATETNSSLQNYNVSNADSTEVLNASTSQQVAIPFTVTAEEVVRQIETYISKTGTPSGTFVLQIVRDSSGSPSTNPVDVLAQSSSVDITALTAGNNTVTQAISDIVLVAASYWVVIKPDATYIASFVGGTTQIALRTDTSAPTGGNIKDFNGTTWSTVSGESGTFFLRGIPLDLRVKITSATAGAKVAGLGVLYSIVGQVITQQPQQETQTFSGDSNPSTFTVSAFLPSAKFLAVYQLGTGKVFRFGDFTINGQIVTFPANTFNLPGETISLLFDQTQSGESDSSSQNSANIATLSTRLGYVDGQIVTPLQVVDLTSQVSVPNTTIVNRATIADPANDLGVRFGVSRTIIPNIYRIQAEYGPNGEQIYGADNEVLGRVRYGGSVYSQITGNGPIVFGNAINDFAEFTFYGTGFNILHNWTSTSTRDIRASVDGGAEGGNILVSNSGVLSGRNRSTNYVTTVAFGLALGVHTVKLRGNNAAAPDGFAFYGYEVLHETTTLTINPGSYFIGSNKYTLAAQQSIAHSTTFESGTLGTRGGHAVVYLKSTGVVAKAVTPTDASSGQILVGSNTTSHTNEEMVNELNFREFGDGGGPGNDLLDLTAGAIINASYVLSDGSTMMQVVQCNADATGVKDAIVMAQAATSAWSITFIGTGLDIFVASTAAPSVNNVLVSIDGGATQSIPGSQWSLRNWNKIVSGLPYGSHTVRFSQVNGGVGLRVSDFQIWGPKKPALPANSVELAHYNIFANYVANATAGVDTIGTGVMRKGAAREAIYIGTWSILSGVGEPGGYEIFTSTNGDAMQIVFFGTGLDFRFTSNGGGSYNGTLQIDGASNFTVTNGSPVGGAGWTGALTTSSYGGGVSSFTASTGVLVATSSGVNGNGISISGLTLGLHIFKVTRNSGSASNIIFNAFDVITPVHAVKYNTADTFQNELYIGSQAIADSRKLVAFSSTIDIKPWGQALGLRSSPSTTSTSFVPVPEMTAKVRCTGNRTLRIAYAGSFYNGTTGAQVVLVVAVDGVIVSQEKRFLATATGTDPAVMSDVFKVQVGAGVHTVTVFWKVDSNTAFAYQTTRNLLVEQE